MTVKLEALVCSNKLRIFENNGSRNYLGFVNVDSEFTEEEIRLVAAMVYSRITKDLKKAPKVEVKVSYQE
ncbi:MAG: hypothetical protein AABW58_04340 [Nanoarchaeota archaeon]